MNLCLPPAVRHSDHPDLMLGAWQAKAQVKRNGNVCVHTYSLETSSIQGNSACVKGALETGERDCLVQKEQCLFPL